MSTIIKFNDVSKCFDSKVLYTDVNLKILTGEKILLHGENGCGKTTFIRMITGEIKPDTGTIYIAQGVKIAKLEQFENLAVNNTVGGYINNIFDYISSIENSIRRLEKAFTIEYSDKVINEYTQLVEHFEAIGGYSYLKKKDEFIHTFGLEKILDRNIATLSGGEQQYLRLASVIFSDASLLILDEPFTFLDKSKVKWLLKYLKVVNKTVILTSHDLYLAREFATAFISIRNWKIKKYRSYDSFLKESYLEDSHHTRINTTIDNYITKREASIAKHKQWMKKADNKHQHAVIIRRLERDIERAEKSKYAQKKVKEFDISNMVNHDVDKSHELLISLKNVTMKFDDYCILDDISLDIKENEHYLFLGDNGVGKTTLLNIIMKNIIPSEGNVIYTKKIKISSLDQFNFDIDTNQTCLDILSTISSNTRTEWINNYSAYFETDFWDKRLSILSGGELKKLFIFMCLLKDFDILLLDEPTAFVDTYAKSSIVKMLESCNKCIIIVTHDPYICENFSGTKYILSQGKINLLA
jgi:ATPase subunit of ABC transporter with duplicated ATPase domains